jgi:uncharacterized protein (DUF1330 family)
MENIMKINYRMVLTLLGGVALGGAAIQGLHAQAKPPTYVAIAIRKINDADGFKAGVIEKAAPVIASFGGHILIRAQKNITVLDGPSPAAFLLIAFDTAEKAQAWHNSEAQKEIDAARIKATESLAFMADGM